VVGQIQEILGPMQNKKKNENKSGDKIGGTIFALLYVCLRQGLAT
jgi:hypothetical protein